MLCIRVLQLFFQHSIKVVLLNNTLDAVEPQESPQVQEYMTEHPPTHEPKRQPEKKRVSGVKGAAVYKNPEVSVTS